MTEELKTLTAKLEDVAARMGRIEERLASRESGEVPGDPPSRWRGEPGAD